MEVWILGGYSGTFGFGFREKNWKFGFWGDILGPSDLDLGKKIGSLDFGGSILGPSDLDLGKKVGSLDLGGYSGTFGFGLREKSWKFGFLWGGILGPSDLDLQKKVGSLDFCGGYSGKVIKKNLLYRKIDLINLE